MQFSNCGTVQEIFVQCYVTLTESTNERSCNPEFRIPVNLDKVDATDQEKRSIEILFHRYHDVFSKSDLDRYGKTQNNADIWSIGQSTEPTHSPDAI